MAQLKLAIFDMDGLILDSETYCLSKYNEVFEKFGSHITLDEYCTYVGLRSEVFYARMKEDHIDSCTDIDACIEECHVHLHRTIETDAIPVKAGIVEVLEELRRRGIPRYVATSTNGDLPHIMLTNAGVRDHFDTIISGNMAKRSKPAPDIFLACAEKAGVEPEECIVFEDSEFGCLAGIAAGMKTVAVPDLKPPAKEILDQCTACCETIDKVIPLLDQMFDKA